MEFEHGCQKTRIAGNLVDRNDVKINCDEMSGYLLSSASEVAFAVIAQELDGNAVRAAYSKGATI